MSVGPDLGQTFTVLPTKRNSGVIFVTPLDQVECTSYCLLSNGKHNFTSLSLLAGRTVANFIISQDWQVKG